MWQLFILCSSNFFDNLVFFFSFIYFVCFLLIFYEMIYILFNFYKIFEKFLPPSKLEIRTRFADNAAHPSALYSFHVLRYNLTNFFIKSLLHKYKKIRAFFYFLTSPAFFLDINVYIYEIIC